MLNCKDLYAIVPAHVASHNVALFVSNVLDLRFEEPLSFAMTVRTFYFRFRSLQVCCPLPSWVFTDWCVTFSCTQPALFSTGAGTAAAWYCPGKDLPRLGR